MADTVLEYLVQVDVDGVKMFLRDNDGYSWIVV